MFVVFVYSELDGLFEHVEHAVAPESLYFPFVQLPEQLDEPNFSVAPYVPAGHLVHLITVALLQILEAL